MDRFIRNVISMRDFEREGILHVLQHAAEMEEEHSIDLLQGHVLGIMFAEPSTRTRLSFASAMMKLGGQVLDFGAPERSSFQKGESLADTIRTIAGYCDVMTIRHSWEGAARRAAEISDLPVINAGDGANQHPTQTFLDLYTIQKECNGIDDLTVGFVGDLRFSRTVHSLAEALSHFEGEQVFIAPETLHLPSHVSEQLDEKGVRWREYDVLDRVLPDLDVLYCTRIQEERFADRMEYEQVKSSYQVNSDLLQRCGARDNLKIMHPLPRVDELARDVDDTQYAVYFQQAHNGIPVRQALLAMVLGKV
ncbi:MAG: aspartate carbamoyltransferase [Planctomycetota bacterium]